ncbi:hydroquinone glucosyltransferase-like [Elaeis guineensis]|uniref:Glycosyltransferase n=1 Tax=Elaeis guineensis var. tenera TaxID=51953 RepID=A0A6I9RG34_ELAGV|nr:hydroquinone glucosyltransferase-like [Elaeis guineensis]
MEDRRPRHIALLSSPGMGHLIPLASFARHLARHHHFAITLIAHPTDHSDSSGNRSFADSLPDEVNVVSLPNLPPDAFPDTKAEARVFLTVKANLPHLRSLLRSLESTAPLAALVVDPFCLDAFDIAAELGLPVYFFSTSSCMILSFAFHLPALDASFVGEYRDLPEPVRLPGCVPVQGKDLIEPIQDRGKETYKLFLNSTKRLPEAKGVLTNSFEDLEPGAVKGLKDGEGIPPVYPVGPLIWTVPDEEHECLRWLDRQPPGSVVYVSFGSGGTLTLAQTRELALGLEISGQRFLWVAKSPHESEANAAYLSARKNEKNPLDFLPEGFLERTKDLGFIVPSWVPQVQVLGHASTGGFLTHCGWNSTLESIVKGVPLIAWPLYAEQKMNAIQLTEDVKVALRPKVTESGLVGREEISRVVKCLMEGEEGKRLRKRAKELSDAAGRALGPGGSSIRAMADVAREWMDGS